MTASVSLCRGRELPPLLHSHPLPASATLARPPAPAAEPTGDNKPRGGVWASPGTAAPGAWRPIPRWSDWIDYCLDVLESPERVAYQTVLLPHRGAQFLLVDSTADADALHAAFPDTTSVMAMALAAVGEKDSSWGRLIDWPAAVAATGAAGVYLTESGRRATRLPPEPGHVRLYLWDVPSAWFARRAYSIERTDPRPPANPIPVDDREFDLSTLVLDLLGLSPGRPVG
jgi:hypothetical protein